MNEFILRDNLYGKINTTFKENSVKNHFIDYVTNYIDQNNTVLYANSPLYRLFFNDEKDRKMVFNLTHVDPKEVKELVSKIDSINSNWKIVTDPFNLVMTHIIRYSTIIKDEKLLYNSLLYITLSLYSSLHFKYYPYLPNENCMNYTVNNISNKYLFKRYGILIKALYHTSLASHEKYKEILIRGGDLDIKDYIMNLRTRLNNLIQNFTDVYIKNLKSKKYLNTETDSQSEDDYYESDNLSLLISKLSSQSVNKFYSTEINQKFVRVSCKYSNCSPVTLNRALESVKKNESNKIEEIFRLILSVYLLDGKNSYDSIASQKFILYNLSMYSKSNIKDTSVLKIKEILNYFLMNHSNKYSDTEREATRVSYRKALYLYLIFFLQYCKMVN